MSDFNEALAKRLISGKTAATVIRFGTEFGTIEKCDDAIDAELCFLDMVSNPRPWVHAVFLCMGPTIVKAKVRGA